MEDKAWNSRGSPEARESCPRRYTSGGDGCEAILSSTLHQATLVASPRCAARRRGSGGEEVADWDGQMANLFDAVLLQKRQHELSLEGSLIPPSRIWH